MQFGVALSFVAILVLSGISLIPQAQSKKMTISPEWMENLSHWYEYGKVSDRDFITACEYLIDKKIVAVNVLDCENNVSFGEKLVPALMPQNLAKSNFTLYVKSDDALYNANTNEIRNFFVYVEPSSYRFANFNSSLTESMSYWEEIDGVKFKYIQEPQDATFTIRGIHQSEGPYSAYTINKNVIEIGMGDSRCNGVWHAYGSDFVLSLLKHEIGHALGHEHSKDRSNIMYPLVLNAKYAPVNVTYTLDSSKPLFIPVCTFSGVSSFHFKVMTKGGKSFDTYFVDSLVQNHGSMKDTNVTYYRESGCYSSNSNNFESVCRNIPSNSKLVIVPDRDVISGQKVHVFIEELT